MPRADSRERDGKEQRVGSRAIVGSAVAATVFYLLSVVALGTPPTAAQSGAQVVVWFREHGDGVRWSTWPCPITGGTGNEMEDE